MYKEKFATLILSIGIMASTLLLPACTPEPPKHVDNVCNIFKQYPKWYWYTQDTEKKWGVPISVQMAIIHQESRFNGKAKPEREKLLWVIPWKRPSSSYGYSQALKQTWDHYQKSNGTKHKSRNNFADASDFIGWYGYQAYRKVGIPRNNAYELYLAYHEGLGGYKRGTYKSKTWLIHVAQKVQRRANLYQQQLNICQSKLKTRPWWHW